MPSQRPGTIVTFLADLNGPRVAPVLADVAWVLAASGRRVLAVDWDLGRARLHRYLRPFLADPDLKVTDGVLDFALECASRSPADDEPVDLDRTRHVQWPNILRYAVALEWTFEGGGELDLLPCGRLDATFAARAAAFDWETFYRHRGGVSIFEEARGRLQAEYDFVLVGGRPAGEDPAGVTTQVLPDRLVALLSLDDGVLARTARETDAAVAVRPELDVLPVPVHRFAAQSRQERRDWRAAHRRFDRYLEPRTPAEKRAWWRDVARPEPAEETQSLEVLAAAVDRPEQKGTTLAATERLAAHLVGGELGEVAYLADTDRRRLLAVYAVPDRAEPSDDQPTATGELAPPPVTAPPRTLPRASTEARAPRRGLLWAAVAALAFAGAIVGVLLWQRREPAPASEVEVPRADSDRLAIRSEEIRVEPLHDPELSLLLAVEAVQADPSPAALRAIRRAIAAIPARRPRLVGSTPALGLPPDGVGFSHDGERFSVSYSSAQFEDRRVAIYRVPDPSARRETSRGRREPGALELDLRLSNADEMAVSEDFRRVATTDLEGRVEVAAIGSGRTTGRRPIGQVEPPVLALALDPEGGRLAAAAGNETIHVWDLDGGEPSRMSFEGVRDLAFGPRGRTLLAIGTEGARVWNLARRQPIDPAAGINDPGAPPTAWAFSGNGRFLATGRADGAVRVWQLPDGNRLARAERTLAVAGLALSPDGGLVAAVGGGQLGLWETAAGEPIGPSREEDVAAAAFYPFGSYLLTGSSTGAGASLWHVERDVAVSRLPDTEPLVAVDVDLSGAHAVTATANGAVRLWRLLGGSEAVAVDSPDSPVTAALDPAGTRLLVADASGRATVWTADGERLLDRFDSRSRGLSAAAWSPDGSRVAAATVPEGRLWIWTPGGDEAPRQIPGNDHRLSPGAISPDGTGVVTGSAGGLARIWRLDGGGSPRIVRGHRGQVWSAAFSPDGTRVVTAGADRQARIVGADGSGPARVLAGHEDQVWSAAFSPDGTRVVTASADGTARIWPVEGDEAPVVLAGHRGHVWSAAFSADGEWVATGSADGTVRIWPVDGKAASQRVGVHAGQVVSVAFGPEGRRIVAASADGSVRVWHWRPRDLVDQACGRLTRNLTREEWRREIGDEVPWEATCPDLGGS